jgi:hypothetical protein
MNPNELTIQSHQLMPGDVILCVIDDTGRLTEKIRRETESRYTHAAICISPTEVVDVNLAGIRKITIQKLVSESVYAAVFRNKLIWNEVRIKALNQFLDQAIQSGSGYDFRSFRTFIQRNQDHQLMLLAKIKAFFEHGLSAQPHKKPDYTCSELVAACFIEVGFITLSAASVFQSDTYSPGALGRESYFGFLLGYLKPRADTVIPLADEFANNITLSELDQAEQDFLNESSHLS